VSPITKRPAVKRNSSKPKAPRPARPSKPFENQVALVTGGSRGIGKAIALELAQKGAHVAFNYFRSEAEAKRTEVEVKALGVECLRIKAHLGEEEKIKALFSAVEKRYHKLDILVNNAASGVQRPALELESKHWDWTMSINAKAPWLCAREAARLMPSGGKIVNITSLGSHKVLPFYFSVGVSKASLEALTRYLAVELAPLGIAVNAVSAGYIETSALKYFPNKEDMLAASRETTPAKRKLAVEDVAKVVAFLCTKDAEMIRGQTIIVDGGFSLTI